MDTQHSLHIQQFYGWWQFAVCLFAFLALMAIWYHIGRKQKDVGQVWLGLSILCWSFSGGLEVLSPTNPNLLEGGKSILSLLNSLFILLALPWFKYLPDLLQSTIQSKNWKLLFGLPFVFSLLPTIRLMISGESSSMMSELDVYYSILTLALLGMVLWETFQKRRLPLLAYLSVICILITFIAQLYKLTNHQANQSLLSAIFKATLIMIFFALALSWVKELSESLQVRSDYIALFNATAVPFLEREFYRRVDHAVGHLSGLHPCNHAGLSRLKVQSSGGLSWNKEIGGYVACISKILIKGTSNHWLNNCWW